MERAPVIPAKAGIHFDVKALFVALCVALPTAHAQSYPSKPIRLVVPFPPGGPADLVARPLAQRLNEALGQPVIVDNRPGATGTIGASLVAKSPADGYTLLLGTSNEIVMSPGLYAKLPYDPNRDFTAVTPVITFPNILVVNPALPVRSAKELVALARSNPQRLNFGTSGIGSTNHLTGELFKSAAQVKVSFVAYKGGGPATTDLVAGHIEAMFATLPSAVALVNAGKLRGLMVTDAKRWHAVSAVPSAPEAGLAAVQVLTWNGVLGPAGLPPDVLERLHQHIVKIMATQDMKDRMTALASEATTSSAREFAETVRSDFAKWVQVIKQTGIRAE
ncbi:MAG TPA: tripartite tricarboxylate transporter substrate binding protein [Burkholderiales bacterium]|nr:tripartite tricarboxylate transporter substrate binding protein [Burkholderiales bacterium]